MQRLQVEMIHCSQNLNIRNQKIILIFTTSQKSVAKNYAPDEWCDGMCNDHFIAKSPLSDRITQESNN